MKTQIDNIIKAINMADFDNIDTLEVSIEDLKLLRAHILEQQETLARVNKEARVLHAKLSLRNLERPRKLKEYINMQEMR